MKDKPYISVVSHLITAGIATVTGSFAILDTLPLDSEFAKVALSILSGVTISGLSWLRRTKAEG